MSGSDFMNNCTACGGNWTAMLLTGIKRCFPEFYEKMEDRTYSFEEVYAITRDDLGIDWNK